MKRSVKKLTMLVFLMNIFSLKSFSQDKKPWVYFDLGDTIIKSHDMNHLKYVKGAREYMEEIKREGFKIGIISNIPENWGMDYDEKLLTLKRALLNGWEEDRPFDWSVYDEVILPLKNMEMKPAPTLFLKAINLAETCPSVYIGESPKEIAAAIEAGMAAKLFIESDEQIYMPVNSVKDFIALNYHRDYDKNCL